MNLTNRMVVLTTLVILFSGCLTATSDIPEAEEPPGLMFMTELGPALEAAKEENKPVFVYFRSEYCGWCRKFESETFTNESVIQHLNENFILVSIDVYEQKNETRDFRVRGTPVEVFLDSNGTEIKRIPGYTDTDTFLMTIKQIA